MVQHGHGRRMGRPPLDEVGGGERRIQILIAAGRHFQQRGFAAVSLGDIAGEVGVTKAALYHHFQSKDELYTDVLCGTLVRIAAAIDRVTEQPVSTREKLVQLVHIAVFDVPKNADMDSMMRDVAEHLTTEQREQVLRAHRGLEDAYVRLMESGIARGELRPYQPRLLAHAFHHLLAAFTGRVGAVTGYQGKLETVETVVELFLHGAGEPCDRGNPAPSPAASQTN